MIDFKCSCGKALRVPDSLARKIVTCNQCGRRDIQLPGAGEKLDLSDYELEDAAGTIVLEPPASNSFKPRKAVSQPAKTESPVRKSRNLPRREARVEPEPEPEFEDAPVRPSKNTKRLDTRRQQDEAPAPSRRPSRRGSQRKPEPIPEPVEEEVEEPEEVQEEAPLQARTRSTLKAKSSQVALKRSSSVKKNVGDEIDTVEGVQAPRRGSSRADRNNRRSSEARGRRTRNASEDDEVAIDNGNSQKFIIIILVAIVILGGGLFYYFKMSDKKPSTAAKGNVPLVDANPQKVDNTPKPKPVEAPQYENITEVGKALIAQFGIKGSNRDAIEAALEEKRKKAVEKKLSTKSYDSYIKEVLQRKLAYVFAIEHALENVTFDSEEHKFILFTLQKKIEPASLIAQDEEIMKDFPLDLKAEKITWDKETLILFLDKVKKIFDDEFNTVPLIKEKLDWKIIVEIVKDGKVEDDTFNGPALEP